MANKVRIGIIGCGGIANGKHMPSLAKVAEAEMVAFCDIVEERAVEAAKKYADKVAVKSGYIDGKYVDEKGVKAYAAIPSKNELYSILAGTLSNFTRGLACAIKAVADKKAEAQA